MKRFNYLLKLRKSLQIKPIQVTLKASGLMKLITPRDSLSMSIISTAKNLFLLVIILLYLWKIIMWASQVALVVKNPPANAEDIRNVGSIPGLGRSPGGGHGNPLQYSCLENPMDRRAWQATVHRVTKSWTCLKWLSMHTSCLIEPSKFLFS